MAARVDSLPRASCSTFSVSAKRSTRLRSSVRRVTRCGGEAAKHESNRFPRARTGWQVTADRLHEVLRAAAAQVGVRLLDRRATEADLAPDGPLILDCTGRAGVVSRHHHLRIYEDGPRTVAIIGRWRPGAPRSSSRSRRTP